jgi:hypothetical protein
MSKEVIDFAVRLEYREGPIYPEVVKNLELYAYLTLV